MKVTIYAAGFYIFFACIWPQEGSGDSSPGGRGAMKVTNMQQVFTIGLRRVWPHETKGSDGSSLKNKYMIALIRSLTRIYQISCVMLV